MASLSRGNRLAGRARPSRIGSPLPHSGGGFWVGTADETWAVSAANNHAARAAAAKRTVLAAASIFALVALALVGTTSAAPPDKDRTDPSTPTNLHVAAATKTTVTLAWDASSDDVAVAGYYVFGDRGKATVDTNLEQPTYTVSGLSCGQTVSLSVVAFDAAGNRSQQANATVSSAPCSDSVPPSSPSGFTQLSTSENAVVLAWTPSTDNVGVVSYGVYRNLALVQSASDPQVALGGLSCGSTYEYAFDAVDAAGNRSQLATANVRTSDCPAPTPAPSDWTFCSNEWEHCSFSGQMDVRYGANGTFTSPRTFTDGVDCTNAVFGDPLVGTSKQCQTRTSSGGTSSPPAPSTDTQPPSAPSGLASSNVTQTGLTLTWNASSDNVGVVSYDLSRDGTQVASPTAPSASVSGLTCASSYAFAVRARDAAGNVSQAAQLSVATAACSAPAPAPAPDTQAPTAPASLAISAASATSVSLTWNASSDNVGVAGYRSYRDSSYVSTGSQTATTISGLACGTAHTFAVNAFDQAGNSSASSSVIGSTLACADTQAPSAPANVSISSRTATSIALTWSPSTDNVGVIGYGLYQGGTSTLQSAGTVGIFTGLVCNTNYTLAIDAVDAAGNRSAKTTVMVSTTACPDTQAPSAPTGLAASNVTQTGLTLSWSASSDNVGVVSYDVYRNGTKVTSATSPSASQTALTCGASYTFGVEALDAAGNRSSRATLSVSTAACATTIVGGLSPPSTIKADCSVDVTSALLSWLATVPDNSTVSFSANACYRIEGTLLLTYRHGLIFEGNGAIFRSFNPMTSGVWADGQRAVWRVVASTGIVFRNMTIDGAYTHGGVHDPSLQWAHGIDLRGTQADISNVTMTDLAGDCVFFGLNYFDELGRSSGSVKDSTCLRIGRNAVSVTAANDVLVQRVTTDQVGFTTFDVEPDLIGPGDGSNRITFDSNTIGSYYLYAYAIVQNAANVDQKFTANRGTSAKGLRIGIVDPASKGFRPQRVTISGNSATSTTQSPAMDASNIDGLTVTNNNLPTNTLLKCSGVTGLTISGNSPSTSSGC
jgi:chitodextrinase